MACEQRLVPRERVLAVVALVLACSGCDIDTFVPLPEFGGPAGVIRGTVTYSGPAPCTAGGHIAGAAVLFAFDEVLLPPPEGLGTVPSALTVVSGDRFFDGIRSQLAFDPGGAEVCPPPGSPNVTQSFPFDISPLVGGAYQIRGFYDLDGDFNPAFSISNLPSAGDIGGGAIDNPEEVLLGGPPRYRVIALGDAVEGGGRVIPPTGALVEGVAVTLGLALPLERPVFHLGEVLDANFGNSDPNNVVIPSDYLLNVFSVADPTGTESSFVRLVLRAGVPEPERALGAAPPFRMAVDSPLLLTRQDVNGDGVIDAEDHIPDTDVVPALLPLAVLTRLRDGAPIAAQSSPSIVLQGVTLRNDLIQTVVAPADLAEPSPQVVVGLRPAVLCIDTSDRSKDALLVNTHPTDGQGNVLIPDQGALEGALSNQFKRTVRVVYGCLPEGRYALNLVYQTGQAWTVPNEAGVCAVSEPESPDGQSCGTRAKLGSQGVVVQIGPPRDAAYCAANPLPDACLPVP
jgi:hypothetical protein